MKNLDIIYNIWRDLEQSFQNNKDYDDRIQYLYDMVDYNKEQKTTRIDYLKYVMSEEMKSYSQKELDKYSEINTKLNAVENFILNTDIRSIGSLNDVEMASVSSASNKVNRIRKLPEDFFNNLLPIPSNKSAEVQKQNESFFADIYGTVESFGDTFYISNGEIKKLFMTRDYKECFILNNKYDLEGLKNSIKKEKTRFNVATYNACFALSQNNKLMFNLVFVDKKYLDIRETKTGSQTAKVLLQGFEDEIKLTKRNIIEDKDNTFYEINLQTKYDKYKVIFV